MKKKHSTLSILAIIFTFICCGTIGFILGIIDLVSGNKEQKHILSIISVSISGFLLAFYIVFMTIGMVTDTSDVNNDYEKVTISNEIIDEEIETEAETQTEKITEEKVIEKITEKITEKVTDKPTEKSTEKQNKFVADGLHITVNKVDLNFTDYEDDFGFYKLDNDKKYVMVSFTFDNKDDDDKYVSMYDFDCYADGTLCDMTYVMLDEDVLGGNLSPGRNLSFRTCYIVPKNAKSIELEYEVNMWTEEKLIIKLK